MKRHGLKIVVGKRKLTEDNVSSQGSTATKSKKQKIKNKNLSTVIHHQSSTSGYLSCIIGRLSSNSSYLFLFSLLLTLYGCLATSKEVVELRDEINQLQLKLNELQGNQADLSDTMTTLNANMLALSEKLEENKNIMNLISRRLDDMEASIISKVSKLSEKLPASSAYSGSVSTPSSIEIPPSELYRMAYDDFVRGRYELSITGFKNFIERYPDATLIPYARYYLGESYYAKMLLKDAYNEFKSLEREHPKSDMVLPARFKKALILEKMGKTAEARALYEDIIKNHPTSPEAAAASERIKVK